MRIVSNQDAQLLLRAGELRNKHQQLETMGIVTPRYPKQKQPIGAKKSVPYF